MQRASVGRIGWFRSATATTNAASREGPEADCAKLETLEGCLAYVEAPLSLDNGRSEP